MNDERFLWRILPWCRPNGSKAIQEVVDLIKKFSPYVCSQDVVGNIWIDARANNGRTMFMAHLDTVHQTQGRLDLLLTNDKQVYAEQNKSPAILGADDGAGVALLLEMLTAGVPALYLFSQGEECGGFGGQFAAQQRARFDGIDRLVSFDRRGKYDICGAQIVGTLASEDFVSELAKKLSMGHKWAEGTYTDNSEFQGLIPEIVNVSVGYEKEHSVNESLDYDYWCRLREACIHLDWESLPTVGPDTSRDDDRGDLGHAAASYPSEDVVLEEFHELCFELKLKETSYKAILILEALERVAGISQLTGA